MSFFGTFVLARSDTLLPHVPGMRSAFGSRFVAVHRYDNGWQLAHLNPPMYHEWPKIHGGSAPLAIATGAPTLAVEIKESYCLQYGGAAPDGSAWLAHFANTAERTGGTFRDRLRAAGILDIPPRSTAKRCAFDHHEECTVPLPDGADVPDDDPAALADSLSNWAVAAGLSATASGITDAIGTHTDDEAVWGLIDALGLHLVETVHPLFTFREHDWWDAWRIGRDASLRVFRAWDAYREGGELASYDRPLPGADEFVRFLDLVAASMFGGGLTKEELRIEATRLVETYASPNPSHLLAGRSTGGVVVCCVVMVW
ncbi:hypothetical protein ABT297_42675 [Dactylosporangium sp. NPDC000555]|uniref:hypothetical protein n=1 Tax=Dactylosporangium sp. NPDC000555 TaxID=3154260 RepID=UPI00331B87CC